MDSGGCLEFRYFLAVDEQRATLMTYRRLRQTDGLLTLLRPVLSIAAEVRGQRSAQRLTLIFDGPEDQAELEDRV